MRRYGLGVIGLFLVLLVVGVGCDSSDTTSVNNNGPVITTGSQFVEKYTCNYLPAGGTLGCDVVNATDTIEFTQLGGNSFEARDVPDSGFLYTGTFNGLVFTWTATSPSGYSEAGTWTFDSAGSSFSGTSHYVADDASYSGDCNTTGVLDPGTPPDPPMITGCP